MALSVLPVLCRVVGSPVTGSVQSGSPVQLGVTWTTCQNLPLIDVALNGVAQTDNNGLTREGFRTAETQMARMHLEKLKVEDAVIRFVGISHT